MKNKIFALFLSVFVACCLWMYVVTVEHTQIELTFYNIPVNWNGEEAMQDRDLRLVDRNLTVSMKLYGNRSVLNKMKSSDIIVLADLTHVNEAGEKKLSYDVSFSGAQTEVIEIVDRPASIDVQVARWLDKTIAVDVLVDENVQLGTVTYEKDGKGYEINFLVDRLNISSEPKTVQISGPYEVVDQITKAQVRVDMTNSTTSFQDAKMVTLCDKDGNGVDAKNVYVSDGGSVNAYVPLLAEREIEAKLNIKIDTSLSRLLRKEDVKVTFLPKNTMKIRGSLEAVMNYPDYYDEMTFEIKDINQKTQEKTFTISLPQGMHSDTAQITAKIELPDYVKETFTVPQNKIQWNMQPIGYEWKMPEDFKVTLLHKTQDKIDVENINIVVTYNGQPAGDGKYDYRVVLMGAASTVQFRDESTDKKIAIQLCVPEPDLNSGENAQTQELDAQTDNGIGVEA